MNVEGNLVWISQSIPHFAPSAKWIVWVPVDERPLSVQKPVILKLSHVLNTAASVRKLNPEIRPVVDFHVHFKATAKREHKPSMCISPIPE